MSVPLTTDEAFALAVGAQVLGDESPDALAARALRRGLELRTGAVCRRAGTVQAIQEKKPTP